ARDRASCDSHCRFTRRCTAATTVVADAVFLLPGVVRMTGTKLLRDIGVVARARIIVLDQERNRRARRHAFKDTGQYPHAIGFAALRSEPRGASAAAFEIVLDVVLGQRHARWAAIDDGNERGTVTFAGRGDAKALAEAVARHRRAFRKMPA